MAITKPRSLGVLILAIVIALAASPSAHAEDANNHLNIATESLQKAKTRLKQDRESMAKQKSKLQADLQKALTNMKKLQLENKELRQMMQVLKSEMQKIQEESTNPSIEKLIQLSMDTVTEYMRDLENFDDVEALAADIEARMALVFGKQHSWLATLAVIAIAILSPAALAIYVLLRVVRLVGPSAYAATFATVMFSYIIAIEFIAIFTGSDPFTAFRQLSERWYITSQWALCFVAVAFLYLTVSLAISESNSSVKAFHASQTLIFLVLAGDYSTRIFLPSVRKTDMGPVPLAVLVLYVLATAALLLVSLRIESLKHNLKAGAVEAASTAVFRGDSSSETSDAALKSV